MELATTILVSVKLTASKVKLERTQVESANTTESVSEWIIAVTKGSVLRTQQRPGREERGAISN